MAIPHMLVLPSPPHHQPNMWAAFLSSYSSWVTVYNCKLCEKVFFSKIGPKSVESYLCNEKFDRQNKICLRNTIPFLFFIFYDFFNLNPDFRVKLRCRGCVQLQILWKTCFSQTLRCHIFITKRWTDKVKHELEMSILSCFLFLVFIFYYFLNLN